MNRLVILSLLVCLTACSKEPSAPEGEARTTGVIRGTVTYREQVAISDLAVLEVKLEDVSRQDVAADVIAELRIKDPGQVPIHFELEYPLAAIDPGGAYALRIRLSDGENLRWVNDSQIPVLTRGAGSEVRATLKGFGVPKAKPAIRANTGIELRGQFRYMADAARFTDCRTGKDYPVAMEGAYKELESAYLNSGIEAGKEAHVVLAGRLLERPSMENSSSEIKLIVDHFDKLDTQSDCVPVANADLRNTYWKLVEIDGRPVKTPKKQREAHVILASDGSRAHGNAGCNNFFGSFEADEEDLRFSALGSTMMNCAAVMDTEKAFLGALGETIRYRISGQSLELFAGDRLLARLEAVYL